MLLTIIITGSVAPKCRGTVRQPYINISVLLRIMFCTTHVDVEKLRTLAGEVSVLITKKLKWVSISNTLIGLLHHSVEMI